eukprot:scaffold503477_cov18-Prasinocladus_malaysianus.AAC.1
MIRAPPEDHQSRTQNVLLSDTSTSSDLRLLWTDASMYVAIGEVLIWEIATTIRVIARQNGLITY